jgi:outer membrane protein
MKKFLPLIVLATGLLIAGHADAQKIGYIHVDNIVGLMPETAKIDSTIQRYQVDSLNPEYASLVSRYQFKDSVYRDSLKTPPAVRKEIEKELPTLIYQIQNWQTIVQQATEQRQNEILAPIYRKVLDAIKAVAKEKGYTYVLTRESLLVMPEADDLSQAVALKLKLKWPPVQQQPKAGN